MLELKTYTKAELVELFGTRSTEGLKRKMKGYGITFNEEGHGQSLVFEITNIAEPFKVFCITEFGFDGRTDFYKLRNFYYYFFNDDEFMAMPDEVKENRMRETGQGVSRQTIAGYIARLDAQNLINRNTTDFIYYFAYKNTQRIVERSEYSQAWQEYWKDKKTFDSFEAIWNMREKYGGVAKKQAIPEVNSIYTEKIEYLCGLIQESIENEIAV